MSTNKELTQEQLEKVNGGVTIGDHRIVECESCHQQFDPDTVERGPDQTEESENGMEIYRTFKCPYCLEFHRVKFIQIKLEDITMDNASCKIC